MKYTLIYALAFVFLSSCNRDKKDFDAAGYFEADEVIVSAQQNGELLLYIVNEGQRLEQGALVGQIDVTIPTLQKQQTEATIASLSEKTSTATNQVGVVRKQLAVQQAQLQQLQRERARTQNLVAADAAPRKQLDDLNAQIDQLQKAMAVTREQIQLYNSATATQNRSILSERTPLQKTAEQFQAQINKGKVINPVSGIVLTNYALQGEVTGVGKPLYKIADIDTLYLRAYVTGEQLPQLRLNQPVAVRIDGGSKAYKTYEGNIIWISDKSEFTPKTIQTKNERANLVYAVKVKVKNDGYLKIGMYGEVVLAQQNTKP